MTEQYKYAMEQAIKAAQSNDYAASAAWLDIARELRLSQTPPKSPPTGQAGGRKAKGEAGAGAAHNERRAPLSELDPDGLDTPRPTPTGRAGSQKGGDIGASAYR